MLAFSNNIKSLTHSIKAFVIEMTQPSLSTQEDQRLRHELAHEKGGMRLHDEGNVIPGAVKDFLGKVANKIIKAQLTDILKTAAPAYIHYPRTYL